MLRLLLRSATAADSRQLPQTFGASVGLDEDVWVEGRGLGLRVAPAEVNRLPDACHLLDVHASGEREVVALTFDRGLLPLVDGSDVFLGCCLDLVVDGPCGVVYSVRELRRK